MSRSNTGAIQLHLDHIQPNYAKVVVIVPKHYVSTLYKRASLAQKNEIFTYGFPKGATPLSYIEQNYKATLLDHVKEFLFKYFVMSSLYQELLTQKVRIAGEPRLHDIILTAEEDAQYHFELSLTVPMDLSRWKMLLFKAPKRKNYKDIDRQVESFIKEEQNNLKKYQTDAVEIGDWVCFFISLTDEENQAILGDYQEMLWLKIGSEEADIPFQELFIGRKKGESFYSAEKCLQDYFTSSLNSNYQFLIEIKDIVHHGFFSIDHLKHHFKLRSNKEVHQKLIEIFSYRNDLSLRRAMAEESLKLLISKHPFDVPNYLVLRQQKIVLEAVSTNPDYHVYKTQPNFKENIRQLAIKQAKEMLLIDQLIHEENIALSQTDFLGYLNLVKRPRTKEFVYFNLPNSKVDGQEFPLSSVILGQCCLREKTLNHIIYVLTKK